MICEWLSDSEAARRGRTIGGGTTRQTARGKPAIESSVREGAPLREGV